MSTQQDPYDDPIRASVAKVEESYVVAYPLNDCGDLSNRDCVTFSLSDWQDRNEPERGQVVELIDTALYVRGWRARSARPVTPIQQPKHKARRA